MDPYSTSSSEKSTLSKLLNWKIVLAAAICIVAVSVIVAYSSNTKTNPKSNTSTNTSSNTNSPAVQSDPLLSHLPYNSIDFTLNGSISKDSQGKNIVSVNAQLLLSQADLDENGNPTPQAVAQYKQEVLDYITSLGLNPGNYKISYLVIAPTEQSAD